MTIFDDKTQDAPYIGNDVYKVKEADDPNSGSLDRLVRMMAKMEEAMSQVENKKKRGIMIGASSTKDLVDAWKKHKLQD